MSILVQSHGGQLKSLLLEVEQQIDELAKASSLPKVRLSSRETLDLIMLGIGAFSPLDGFMREKDYSDMVETMHLVNGTL